MADEIEKAVLRVVTAMRENYSEDLTVEDMAKAAIFSKFHFSRVFQRVTGLSPSRFLSAVRLHEAKRLLASSSLAVTEISRMVGYSSIGTFSSRFKSSVGVSPTGYRQFVRVIPDITPPYLGHQDGESVVIRGDVTSSPGDRPVFVGLFPGRIMQGLPARCTVLHRAGPFELHDVPRGEWNVMVGAALGHTAVLDSWPGDPGVCIGFCGPIIIRNDRRLETADIRLRPIQPQDPPVLLALCDLHTVLQASTTPESGLRI